MYLIKKKMTWLFKPMSLTGASLILSILLNAKKSQLQKNVVLYLKILLCLMSAQVFQSEIVCALHSVLSTIRTLPEFELNP